MRKRLFLLTLAVLACLGLALPAGAAQDISRLISALFFKVMLNAYVNTYVHGGAVPATYDEEVISRTVRIILLGVKRYYEDKKK